jgi:hypothetical protein
LHIAAMMSFSCVHVSTLSGVSFGCFCRVVMT